MSLTSIVSSAVIPLAQTSASLDRMNRAYRSGTATGETVALSTAPIALSALSLAGGRIGQAGTMLASFSSSLAEQAIAGRNLNVANMSATDIVKGATTLAQFTASSGVLGPTGSKILASALQVKALVTSAYTQYQALGNALPKTSIISNPANATATPTVSGGPNLLILTAGNQTINFNYRTLGFDALERESAYNIATLARLGRRDALQAVAIAAESMQLSGVIFPVWNGGLSQLETLRTIAAKMQTVQLTTGYGLVLGAWYIMRIREEQTALIPQGAPRRQSFNIEFARYGDDFKKL